MIDGVSTHLGELMLMQGAKEATLRKRDNRKIG
jgi:hypothetical protein